MQSIFHVLIISSLIGLIHSVHCSPKPNILFIFADDQCYETIAQLGLTDIETPHIDRLMNEALLLPGPIIWVHGVVQSVWPVVIC